MYRTIYRRVSGPVQTGSKHLHDTTDMTGPAYGCKGLVPLRSTPPCPSVIPHLSAHTRSRDGDAALCLKGKECAPCTLAPIRSHRRMRVGKLAVKPLLGNHSVSIRLCLSGHVRASCDGWNFTCVHFQRMDTTKTAPARRSLLSLAYAQPDGNKGRHQTDSLPGVWFDATVFGLFLFLGVAYFV